MEAYTVSTRVLSSPGSTSSGDTDWHTTDAKVEDIADFGLSTSSDNFMELEENKLENITSYEYSKTEPYVNYSEFLDLTGVESQYYFNFTWMPIMYARDSVSARDNPDLEKNLVVWHEMEEDSGPVIDSSSNSNSGTNVGAEREADGVLESNSFRFSEADGDHVDLPSMSINDSSITVSFWVYKEGPWTGSSGTNDYAFMLGDDVMPNSGNELRIGYESPRDFSWNYKQGSNWYGIENLNPPAQNEWIHLTGTFNQSSGQWRLYKNGNLWAENNDPVNLNLGNQDSNTIGRGGIASGGDEFFFNGKIDEFRIYNKSLKSDEVRDLYRHEAKIRRPPTGFVSSTARYLYGTKNLENQEIYFLVTGDDEYYISNDWNFTGSTPYNTGDTMTVNSRNLLVSDIEKADTGFVKLQQHIKEFGPNRDSDSTVVKLERFGVMKEEPIRVEVLAW